MMKNILTNAILLGGVLLAGCKPEAPAPAPTPSQNVTASPAPPSPPPAPPVAKDYSWPQWRGPNRDDISAETGLLKEWPSEGPKRVWLNENGGLGYAGFSVVKGKLFTMGARGETEFLIALDADTGKELWAAPVGTRYTNRWGDGPRSTPTVDGDLVFTMGGRGDLVCVNVADGKVLWKQSMTALGGKIQNWGYTESVMVDGDQVVCTPGGAQGAIAAFKKTDGSLVWQTKEFTDEAQYASIIPINHYGKKQYIQLTMKSLVGVEPATGKILWKTGFPGKTAVIPTPIYKDGHVFVTAGYNVGCKMVKISEDNQVTEVYANMVMKNHHGGVILVGDHLYGHSDGPGWICQDFKTGEQVWANKSAGKGAIGYADGMLYLLDEANGNVVLIEATTQGWNEKGRFKLAPQTTQRSPQGKIWVHPVIFNGKLYLRDQELIFCFDVKAK